MSAILKPLHSHRQRYCVRCGSADLLHIPCTETGLGWTECLDCEWTRHHAATDHHCHECGFARPSATANRGARSGLPRQVELAPILEKQRRDGPAWAPTQLDEAAPIHEQQHGCTRASIVVCCAAMAVFAALLGLAWLICHQP